MPGSIKADFTAQVELSERDKTYREIRVVLNEDRIVCVADESKRSIPLDDIFDIAQDVSGWASAESIETITIAYHAGELRETASIRGNARTVFRFQQLLFESLLNGTTTLVKHNIGGECRVSPTELSLSVSATRIRFGEDGEDDDPTIVIPRDEQTGFSTGEDPSGNQQEPVASLYWMLDGQPARTDIYFSSIRRFNLFGRYIKSASRLETKQTSRRPGSIEVLLVDDDPADLEMMELFLQRQSKRFSIACATSAAGGRDHLDSHDVDCIVSDFYMPGTNGIEFLRKVRDHHPELPFILFTGQGSEAVAKQAIIDDVTDYVEKDIGTNQYQILAERIQKAVR